jgi:ethanolamine utilization cobalamin adenosyltransferase
MMMKTSLSGDRMVSKTDGRIRFRGLVDSLESETIEAQVLADSVGEGYYRAALGEALDYLRAIMAAEVMELPFAAPRLFGLSVEELHRQSHDVAGAFGLAGHPLPDYRQGPLAARLNTLRAHIREAELCAVQVFAGDPRGGAASDDTTPDNTASDDTRPGDTANNTALPRREDLPLALNRLSSALYWLYCRAVANKR